MTLSRVMRLQAALLFVYGVPYALAPGLTTTLAGQVPVPEPAVLRVLGITFVAMAVVELRALAAATYRPLVLGFALLPCAVFVLIVVQALTTGFNGAAWYWWVNAIVTLVVGVGLWASARARVPAAAGV